MSDLTETPEARATELRKCAEFAQSDVLRATYLTLATFLDDAGDDRKTAAESEA